MQNATHFIEIYKSNYTGEQLSSIHVMPIENLKISLLATAETKYLQTIAVWKIKFKNAKN
jgi:hypothetical protein